MSIRTRAAAVLLAIALGSSYGAATPQPVQASTPKGAVTWTVDDKARTIKVVVRLHMYVACDTCPGAKITPFVIGKIKDAILRVWNRHYHFRCYELIFDVDIKVGTDRFHVDDDRVGVRRDNSPVPIRRSFVRGTGGDESKWNSDDPKDAHVPTNNIVNPTTWTPTVNDGSNTFAHEVGHIMGLHDGYEDVPSTTGEINTRPRPGAPIDLMSTLIDTIDQSTIDRLVKRSPVDRSKLKCPYYTEGTQELKWIGKHCDATDPEWIIRAEMSLAGFRTTDLYTATIDPKTQAGRYSYESIGEIAGGVLTKNGKGTASTVEQPDGTLQMNFSTIYVTGVITAGGTTQTVTLPIPATTFTWRPATRAECP